MAKNKKKTTPTRSKIPKYVDPTINLNGEIHSILESLKEHINTQGIDLQYATDLIQEHLNEVISEIIGDSLNEDLLVLSVINFKEAA